jgi:hypothetical protein
MNKENLPKEYKGYSTAELVTFWDGMNNQGPDSPRVSPEFVLTMHALLKEYRLAPNDWSRDKEERKADMVQAKALLKPFGIDPAPWVDQEGNRQPELEAAWLKKLRREEAERQRRTAST